MKKIILNFVSIIFIFGYFFGLLYCSIKVEKIGDFFRKFIKIFGNAEIGETIFAIIFILVPEFLILLLSKKIGKNVK